MSMWEGGGGFMNDSIADEPQALTSSVSVGGDDKNKAITPVSVSQVAKLTRPNDGLVLHGRKVYHVKVFAKVHEILDMSPTKIHILVDDYTEGGPLEVSHIIGDTGGIEESMFKEIPPVQEDPDQPRDLSSLKVGDYVRCVGVVKFVQDKSHLVAYNIRINDNDPNEIIMHNLEVVHTAMYYEKLQMSGGSGGINSIKDEKISTNYQQNQQKQQPKNDFGNLSNRDKHLLNFLRDKKSERGMSVDEIASSFGHYTKNEIEESMGVLSSEGLCWQGENEDVWCVDY